MKEKRLCIILLVFALSLSPLAFAQEDIWEMANSEQYGKKAAGMFGRGLINAASCFVDIFVQTVEKTQEGPPIVGTLGGIGSGAACTVLRAASGILDVASFWVPGFNGIPVSRSYSDCLAVDETPSSSEAPSSYAAPEVTAMAPTQAVPTPAAQKHDAMEYVKK